ncbi:MAG: dienelactone hydrolase family protein [Dehalococcoidia bacterium]
MAGQMVSFPSNGTQGQGYLATPDSGKGAGVVVIQEWWGLNQNIKSVAERLAGEGYVALAPDLYKGQEAKEPDTAQKLMMAMKMDEAARDLSGAVDYLLGHEAVEPTKIGSIGFCLGGGLSLYLATLKPIDAAVSYYGVLGAQPDFSQVKGAVLGHYAEHDDFASPDSARALEKKLKELGKDAEFHVYPHTTHGFAHEFFETDIDTEKMGLPMRYSNEAAEISWQRTLDFFRKHLS